VHSLTLTLMNVRVNGNITYIFRQSECIIHHEHTRTHVQRILVLHRDGNYIFVGTRHGSIKFETPPKRMLTINNGITWLYMHSVACTCEGSWVYIYVIRFERYDHGKDLLLPMISLNVWLVRSIIGTRWKNWWWCISLFWLQCYPLRCKIIISSKIVVIE
jgi:hypothetical protein